MSMEIVDTILSFIVDLVWGWPIVILLVGGGAFLTFFSRFLPFLGFSHALEVIRGDYDNPNDPGEISHFRALTTALSATVGMGNIAGVAIAITQGGPGAIFWMWLTAIVGMVLRLALFRG
ncbi:MAG: alanine or glycine:cation symporter, AGCS family [Candidatus Kentron sp. G]|nr:MAG: alanine or glycine:cation symporter, AGCS family [Candidatus Kentron sp. G]VFN04711.1 MAG: alanine or glycine:cation symporter, AGCS family [Candidatus Kentron sp. G]